MKGRNDCIRHTIVDNENLGIKLMKICICDDELIFCRQIESLCKAYFDRIHEACEIVIVDNAYEAEKLAEKADLIILDIEMPQMDGVCLKDLLQTRGLKTYILFVTNHERLMEKAFGANVIGFIRKHCLDKELFRYLELSVNLIGKDAIIDGKYHSRQVLFVNSEREYCRLHFINGTTTLVRIPLKKLSQELESVDFIMISRYYLVNMQYITKLNNNYLWIRDDRLKIARRNIVRVRETYENYCERNARYC